MDVSNYKSAVVEYTCDKCFIGNNFVMIFNFDKGNSYDSEQGHCKHIELKFFTTIAQKKFDLFVELLCKNCQNKETRTIIDKNCKDIMANLHYTCKCGEGDLNIGVLFYEEIFDNSNDTQVKERQEPKEEKEKEKQEQKEEKKKKKKKIPIKNL